MADGAPGMDWSWLTQGALARMFGGGTSSGMPAVGTEQLTDAWKGYQAGALGQPALDQTSNPQFATGYAAGAAPWKAPTAADTAAGGGDLAKALGGMGQQLKSGAGAAPQGVGAPGLRQAPIGQPGRPVSLDNLVAILNKRRDAYSPLNLTGQPVQQQRTSGLLGF